MSGKNLGFRVLGLGYENGMKRGKKNARFAIRDLVFAAAESFFLCGGIEACNLKPIPFSSALQS
jgi:hypothetical protein